MGMNHDPLCPVLIPNALGRCFCAFIAGIRADEREKAAWRIDGHSQHGYRCECGADLNNYEHHLQNVIRGEA